MGYGPLVRATIGVTRLWSSEDASDGSFFDATTIFPDHVVARITAIAALAALISREHTGIGARMHISQAEAAINQLDTAFVAEASRPSIPVWTKPGCTRVYPCRGEDEWCVISLRSEADRRLAAKPSDRCAGRLGSGGQRTLSGLPMPPNVCSGRGWPRPRCTGP